MIDLTPITADGVLRWDAPPGRWRILRLGASLTGQTNGPAPADSTGLEVDKLDGARVAAYLETHLARFGDRRMPRPTRRRASRALLSDSIEAGPQNWTDRILEHFASRRGYDPLRLAARRWPAISSAAPTNPIASSSTTAARSPSCFADEYYGTLVGRGASARDDLLRRGARGRPAAARRRPRDALARRRADGRDVDVRSRGRAAADVCRRSEGRLIRRARLRQGRGPAARRSPRSASRGRRRRRRSSTSPTCSSRSA